MNVILSRRYVSMARLWMVRPNGRTKVQKKNVEVAGPSFIESSCDHQECDILDMNQEFDKRGIVSQ